MKPVPAVVIMAEQQSQDKQDQPTTPSEDVMACVSALEAALLPCLPNIEQLQPPPPDFEPPLPDLDHQSTSTEVEAPAMELQTLDDCPPPHHQTDVEKHANEFMEAAKRLQQYFIRLQTEDKPTKAKTLTKEIAAMEEELKIKDELIRKHVKRIEDWKTELKDRLDKHNAELERV